MTLALLRLTFTARFLASTIAPLTDERAELADAIARAVHEAPAHFRDDPEKLRTLTLDLAVGFREGGLQTSIVGDCDDRQYAVQVNGRWQCRDGREAHSFCAFQIHDRSGGTRELTTDALRCARAGHAMIRQSIGACREHPIAWYAEGPRGCESKRAQRISADRVALGQRLLVTAQ